VYANLFFLRAPAAGRWLLLVLLLGCHLGWAQTLPPAGRPTPAPGGRVAIVDDSTKTIYGPKTTHVIFEREVARDSVGGTIIDTTLTRFPQERFWAHDTTFQQNLGTFATATRPLLFQPNLALGVRLGRNAFDRYTRDASLVPYYDSRSPYSFFRYVQGSMGEQVFELSYSRSLKKNFSIGIDYERIASNQVLGTASNQWLVEHNNFTVFGRYQTEDGRYHLLANYSASRHRAREQGGIRPTEVEAAEIAQNNGRIGNTLFKYADELTYLTPSINIDDRDQFHLFQSYRLARRGFTAYHLFDARRQYNGYSDDALPRTSGDALLFYPVPPTLTTSAGTITPSRGVYRNATATNDRVTYRQVENTVGLLGHTDRVDYNLYGRVRNASLREQSTPAPLGVLAGAAPVLRSGTGLPLPTVYSNTYLNAFVGGTAAFNYRTIYAIEAAGEYKFFNEYWLRGTVRTGPLSAELLRVSYAPTLTQLKTVGNHYIWPDSSRGRSSIKDFANTKINQLSIRLQQRLPLLAGHSIDARFTLANINDYVYYGPQGRPRQDSATLGRQLLILSARHRFQLGKFHFDNQATFTRGADRSSNPGLRIPALVANLRAYYQTSIFSNALFGQLGVEYYYQSSWYGYNYAPSTQQFYVQDKFLLPSYGIADVFLAADIKAASIFIKGAYVNQGLGANGYFTAPYYSGYPRRLVFGVRWRFFN